MANEKQIRNQKELNQSQTEYNNLVQQTVELFKKQNSLADEFVKRSEVEKNLVELKNVQRRKAVLLQKERSAAEESALAFMEQEENAITNTISLQNEVADAIRNGNIESLKGRDLTDEINQAKVAGREDLAKQLQILQEQIDALDTGAEKFNKIKDQQNAITEKVEEWKKSMTKIKDLGMAIISNPLTAAFVGAVLLVGILVKTFLEFNKAVSQAQENTGILTGQISDMNELIGGNAATFANFGLSVTDAGNAVENLYKQFRNVSFITDDLVESIGHLQGNLGVTSENAAKFLNLMTGTTKASREFLDDTIKTTKEMAIMNGLAPKDVIEGMAEAGAEGLAAFRGSTDALREGVIMARKMGMEVSSLQAISKGLLNFEDSITKEMEASVLIGKNLNLDLARRLSLEGDHAGAVKELLKQVGSYADFQKLNIVQQDALAAAVGMTREQLVESLRAQERIANMSEAEKEMMEVQAKQLSTIQTGWDRIMNIFGVIKNTLGAAIIPAVQTWLDKVFGLSGETDGLKSVMEKTSEWAQKIVEWISALPTDMEGIKQRAIEVATHLRDWLFSGVKFAAVAGLIGVALAAAFGAGGGPIGAGMAKLGGGMLILSLGIAGLAAGLFLLGKALQAGFQPFIGFLAETGFEKLAGAAGGITLIGLSIAAFAGSMALATPLLLLGAPAMATFALALGGLALIADPLTTASIALDKLVGSIERFGALDLSKFSSNAGSFAVGMGKMAVGSVAGSLAGGVSSIIGGFTDMIGFGGGDVAGEDTGATSSDIKKLRDEVTKLKDAMLSMTVSLDGEKVGNVIVDNRKLGFG